MNTLFFKDLKLGISHLFYPRLCDGCSKPLFSGEEVLCISCGMQLPETGYHAVADNETALRFAGRIPFVHATSFAYFTNDGLLQHLLHGLKYANKQQNGRYLGRQLGQVLLQQTEWIKTIDMIIPVPLHPSKKAKRGYNQSMLIGEGMAEVTGIPVSDRLLVRVRHTESQTNKTRAQRVDNMKDAFKIYDNGALAGKQVLIIDDVLTTGATIEACALALSAADSIKISVATIGIAIS